MRLIAIAVIASCLCVSKSSIAEVVGYKFAGSVSFQFPSSTVFGKTITPPTPVTGRFVYQNDSSATHQFPAQTCNDCMGYEQKIVNGFEATFGSVVVRADDYLVVPFNGSPDLVHGGLHDVVTIEWLSNLTPPLIDPLVVDGSSQTVGRFIASFVFPPTEFPNSQLPATLNPGDIRFNDSSGIFSDNASGAPKIGFSLASLTPFDLVPGDYNFDGVVDDADYSAWRSSFGSLAQIDADGNNDRIVDAADYTVWRSNLGVGTMPSASNSLPEPSSSTILLTLAVAVSLLESFAISFPCASE